MNNLNKKLKEIENKFLMKLKNIRKRNNEK